MKIIMEATNQPTPRARRGAKTNWKAWANAPRDERSPQREADLPTRYYKRPRKGQVLAGATGPELIVWVGPRGLKMVTEDRHGRPFSVSRAPHGVWTIYTTLGA